MVFALVFTPIFMKEGMTGMFAVTSSATILWRVGRYFLIGIVGGLLLLLITVDRDKLRARVPDILLAMFAVVFIHSGFTLLKNVMPFITPYFADPFLAKLDNTIHFGTDPWVIAHWIGQYLPTDLMMYSYLTIWALPAVTLPIIIALTDDDKARTARTLILFFVAWGLIGNIMAFLGLSAGPVYYDRLLGTNRFEGLTEALKAVGMEKTGIGYTQQALWDIYTGKLAKFGSGISAFPSVHVAIATVAAIYATERSKLFLPLAIGFVLITFFFSVYTGYHYAVDGYVSILVVFGIWRLLKRRETVQ